MRFVPDIERGSVQLSPAVAARLLRLVAQGDQRPPRSPLASVTATLPAGPTDKPRRWAR